MEFKRDENNKIVLSKDEAIKLHREMWTWIADEIKDSLYSSHITKTEYFTDVLGFDIQDVLYNEEIESNCFLCHYACNKAKENNTITICKWCPLDWNTKTNTQMCLDKYEACDNEGLYRKYEDAMYDMDYEEAEHIARQIATLEEVKESSSIDNMKQILKEVMTNETMAGEE